MRHKWLILGIILVVLPIPIYAQTTQLLPNTTHNKAYVSSANLGATTTPSNATTEITDSNYAKINVSDNTYYSITSTSTKNVQRLTHRRYTFNTSSINMTNINWVRPCFEGYFTNNLNETDGSQEIYYLNASNGVWIQTSSTTTSDATYCYNFTSNTSFNLAYNSTSGMFSMGETCHAYPDVDTFTATTSTCYADFVNLTVNYNSTAGDTTPPTFSNKNQNTTCAGHVVNISTIISDETALSGFIFETNNTGIFINTSWSSLSSGGTAYNITTLNWTVGTINYSFYANDSSNNWAVYRNQTNLTQCDTPPAPSFLSASTVSSSQIDLSWLDNSINEDGFEIWRKKTADGTYSNIANVTTDTILYHDNGLDSDTIYYYKVRAFNDTTGESNFSNEAYNTTLNETGNVTAKERCEYFCNSFSDSDNPSLEHYARNNDVFLGSDSKLMFMNLDNENLANMDSNCLIYWQNQDIKERNLCINLNSKKAIYLKEVGYEDNTDFIDCLLSAFHNLFG